MRIYHSRDCRLSPFYPAPGTCGCDCGAQETREELERLRDVVAAIERLIESAENANDGPFTVYAADLKDALSGRLIR